MVPELLHYAFVSQFVFQCVYAKAFRLAHPAFYSMSSWVLSQEWGYHGMKMDAELQLVPELSMSGYKPQLPLYAFFFLYCLSHITSKCLQLSSDKVTSLRTVHIWSHAAALLSTDISNNSI